jgi:hypothetical protein
LPSLALLPSQVDLVFAGVGGVEGSDSDEYKSGAAVLTNFRLVWIASQERLGMPFEGVPCHLPLGSVVHSEVTKSGIMGLGKTKKVEIKVRVDGRGYPARDPEAAQRTVLLVLRCRRSSPVAWHEHLVESVARREWAHQSPGLMTVLYAAPSPSPPRPSPGPLTPPDFRRQQLRQQSSAPGGTANADLIEQMQFIGISAPDASAALIATGNSSVDAAVNWHFDHANRASNGPAATVFTTPISTAVYPMPSYFGDDSGGTALSPQQVTGPSPPEQDGPGLAPFMPPTSSQFDQLQQQTPPSRPQSSQHVKRAVSLGNVGMAGIMRRAERATAANRQALDSAFTDLDALMANAGKMVELANTLKERVASKEADKDEEAAAEAAALDLEELGIEAPVTKEGAGSDFHKQLAKEVGSRFVLAM